MTTGLIAIIDRLIQLKQYRDTKLQTVFEKVIEPSFNELLMAHKNYVDMFEELVIKLGGRSSLDDLIAEPFRNPSKDHIEDLRKVIWDDSKGTVPKVGPPASVPREVILEAAKRLHQRRLEFEPVRRKLAGLANEMQHLDINPEIRQFVKALRLYFPTGELHEEISTESETVLERLNYWSDRLLADRCEQLAAFDLRWAVHLALDRCRASWALLCEAYARLKLQVYTHR